MINGRFFHMHSSHRSEARTGCQFALQGQELVLVADSVDLDAPIPQIAHETGNTGARRRGFRKETVPDSLHPARNEKTARLGVGRMQSPDSSREPLPGWGVGVPGK